MNSRPPRGGDFYRGRGRGGRGGRGGGRGESTPNSPAVQSGGGGGGGGGAGAGQRPEDKIKKQKQEEKTPMFLPKQGQVDWSNESNVLVVCYDIENAYGSELSEIYQIGVMSGLDDKCLINILPDGGIHWGVTKHAGTNVTVDEDRTTGQRRLWHVKHKSEIESVQPLEGLSKFVSWLEERKAKYDKLVLLAHGNMDAPCMLNNIAHYGLLDRFLMAVDAFGDTMPYISNRLAAAFERLYPGQRFEAHNALADAEALFKVLLKKQPNNKQQTGDHNKRLNFDQVNFKCVPIKDCLLFAEYRVCKLVQKMDNVPGNVKLIKTLVNIKDLSKVKFINSLKPEDDTLRLESAQFVVLDVQFLQSQGLRSEMVQLSACLLKDPEMTKFEVSCYAHGEEHLEAEFGYKSAQHGINQFMEWLNGWNDQKQPLVIVAFGILHRKWPGLINHCSYYGKLCDLLTHVRGVCDLKKVVAKHNKKLANFDLDKVHKQLFKEAIESYRSDEVLDSNVRIIRQLAKDSNCDYVQLVQGNVQDTVTSLDEVKKKLDNSLVGDIGAGLHFPEGHFASYRMAPVENML
jgi:hypothetical protein